MIQTKELTIGYNSPIIEVDNLELSSGELYFLIGRNGSGKSTFLQTILGQLKEQSGDVFLKEKNIKSIETNEIPKYISFVNAHFPPVDFLRVEEYIALGRSPYSSYFGKTTEKDKIIIEKSLVDLSIEHLKGRFTSELSDGERQMVAIAKAIAQETSIILLDEPTAFLDYANKQLVTKALSIICKKMNKCIILSTHDIDLSIENKGNYLIIDDGKKIISQYKKGITKIEILEMAFNL